MQRPWPEDRLLAALPLMEQIKALHIPLQTRWCSLIRLLDNWGFVVWAMQGVLCDPFQSWHVKIRTELEVYNLDTLYLLVVLSAGSCTGILEVWSELLKLADPSFGGSWTPLIVYSRHLCFLSSMTVLLEVGEGGWCWNSASVCLWGLSNLSARAGCED